jgi:hypothetical protein
VSAVVSHYGELKAHQAGQWQFTFAEPGAAEHVTVSQEPDGITAFSISRPGPPELIRPFLYAAVRELGMAFFTQEADLVWVRPGGAPHLPPDLASRAQLRVVSAPADMWP